MKKIVFSFLVTCILATASFAQKSSDTDRIKAATDRMTALYNLTDVQIPQMQKIQERKYRNLAEIESLKNTDREKYILKLRSIQTGHDGSVDRMLTNEQREIFNQKRGENRLMFSVNYKELKQRGASQEELDNKIIELELLKLENH